MATPAQFAANAANSAFSTGPRSGSGKQVSSLNATAHGLTSRKVLLPDEDPRQFSALCDSVHNHYQPASDFEKTLALRVAETLWRAARADRLHDVFIADRTDALLEERGEIVQDRDSASVLLLVDPVEQKRFSLMLRYLNAAHREHRLAVTELEKVQTARRRDQQQTAIAETWPREQTAASLKSEAPQGQGSHPDQNNNRTSESELPTHSIPLPHRVSTDSPAAQHLGRKARRAMIRAERKAARRNHEIATSAAA